MNSTTDSPASQEYREAVEAAVTALQRLGLTVAETWQVFGRKTACPGDIRAIAVNIGRWRSMDIFDRCLWLVQLQNLAFRHFGSDGAVATWVRETQFGVQPITLLTSGHLHHVAWALLIIQNVAGVEQDPKLGAFVVSAIEALRE